MSRCLKSKYRAITPLESVALQRRYLLDKNYLINAVLMNPGEQWQSSTFTIRR